ncbi:MAG: ABC transporter ATP-binding protein, partial [Gammaproteobacteria bacterium]|nr:ABC transporter ATP-binding protein [Gammaproteobacteria bacterium]
QVDNLQKRFGALVAVDSISFTVGAGEVLGFLGPNGAGKSTTMKMITGFLAPNAGSIHVAGFDVGAQPVQARRVTGYLPEGAPLYPDMTPAGLLDFVAGCRGYRAAERKQLVKETAARVNLDSVMFQRIETLSKGYKRRVGMAQAILHDPAVLILDEPTDGLDPTQKIEMRRLIRDMARDKVIILSTHILEEVQAVCTRAIIISDGKLVADDTPAALEARSRRHNQVVLRLRINGSGGGGSAEAIAETLRAIPEVGKLKVTGGGISGGTVSDSADSTGAASDSGDPGRETSGADPAANEIEFSIRPKRDAAIMDQVAKFAHQHGWTVLELSRRRGSMEEVFTALTTAGE